MNLDYYEGLVRRAVLANKPGERRRRVARIMQAEVLRLLAMTVSARLALYLLHASDDRRAVTISQDRLAAEIGSRRTTVAYLMGEWRRKRIIRRLMPRVIQIHDLPALKALVSGDGGDGGDDA